MNEPVHLMDADLNIEDISQIAIGAFALTVPVSFSEEARKLGESLPASNSFLVFSLSVVFLAFFAYQSVFQGRIKNRMAVFVFRLIVAYLVTGSVVALVLFSIDKLPLASEPLTAMKRLIVISMPASMGAIVVDSFDKE
jgi:uncharacterized membrane protein